MKYQPDQSLSDKARETLHLASLLCDDGITSEQARELEAIVLADVEIRRMYVQLVTLHSGLYRYAAALGSIDDRGFDLANPSGNAPEAINLNETMVLPAFKADDESGTFSETELIAPSSVFQPKKVDQFPSYKKWIAAALLPLGIAICFYFSRSNPAIKQQNPVVAVNAAPIVAAPPPVAILEGVQTPVWEIPFLPPQDGKFSAGQSIALKSGAVQLQLQRIGGGRLVIEGPADLDLISGSEINIRQGNLVAEAPGGGLVVRCPTGLVTDLGTEFGISIGPQGATQVAVFEGHVAASLSSTAGDLVSSDQILKVGQAATISQKAINLNAEGAVPQRFICNLHNDSLNSLDVVDLISGGDGTTHRRGIGVSSTDGKIGALAPARESRGDGKYHRVTGFPVVDGAFVPNGSHGPMMVDSAGDLFQFHTAHNSTFNHIWTGGKIPWLDANQFSTELNGVDYASEGHGLVCLHSNNAITLDLDAVRRIYPDRDLTGFHTLFGNSYVTGWNGNANLPTNAGFFVLIDGKCRYQNPRFSHTDGTFAIDLPLTRTDRFLTVASTDAGISTDHDWIVMADPKLNLAATR